MLADFFGNIDFNGQKVVDLQPIDKKWYQSFRKVHQDFYEFIKSNFPLVMKWTGANANAEGFYKQASAGAGLATTAPIAVAAVAPKVEEKK